MRSPTAAAPTSLRGVGTGARRVHVPGPFGAADATVAAAAAVVATAADGTDGAVASGVTLGAVAGAAAWPVAAASAVITLAVVDWPVVEGGDGVGAGGTVGVAWQPATSGGTASNSARRLSTTI